MHSYSDKVQPAWRHTLARSCLQSGVSLVELMIGLMIGTLLIGAVLLVFSQSRSTYQLNDGLGRLQENGRIAIDMMAEDLRMVGFIGCRRLKSHLPAAGTGSISASSINFSTQFTDAVAASVGISAGSLNFRTTHGFVFPPHLDGQLSGTDSFVVLSGDNEIGLDEEMANPAAAIKTEAVVPAGPAIISDCQYDNDLVVSESPPTGIPAPAEAFMVSTSSNEIDHTGQAFRRSYGIDATVTPIRAVSYSIRNSASAGIPALFRNDDELVAGASNLCVRYGLARNSDNAEVGDFVAEGGVTDWRQVVAVRLELLLATEENVLAPGEATQTLDFCDESFSPDDRRLYRVFTTTVGLRNQISPN